MASIPNDPNMMRQAVMATSQPTDATALMIQGELSQANLKRIRGDVEGAKVICLSLLKNHPQSVDAHVMMGDLNAEQSNLEQAAEWYALAMDIDRSAPGVAMKLTKVKASLDLRKRTQNIAAAVTGTKRGTYWIAAAAVATAFAIGALAFIAGMQNPAKVVKNAPVIERIVTPAAAAPQITNVFPSNSNQDTPIKGSVDTAAVAPNDTNKIEARDLAKTDKSGSPVAIEDTTLLDQIMAKTRYSSNLVGVIFDPRANSLIITFNVKTGEQGRYVGACIADSAMEYETKVQSVTVRGLRNGILSYIADIPRDKIMEVEGKSGEVQDLKDHSWIEQVLTNEYFRDKKYSPSGS